MMYIEYNGKTLQFGKVARIMGILNVTPDSFSDGGRYVTIKQAVEHAKKLFEEGADIIDIGGESTRPHATPLSQEEEAQRVLPVITAVRKELGNEIFLSIDTYKARIAQMALDAGADIINDISGMQMDPNMIEIVAKNQCPIIINHMRGTPQTMQEGEIIYTDVVKDIYAFFEQQIQKMHEQHTSQHNIILDPGIGFGKTKEHNLTLIKRLQEFSTLGYPILIGISKKGFVGTIMQEYLQTSEIPSTDNRVITSCAGAVIARLNGASIIRTHDVQETKKALAIADAILALN